MMYYLIMVIILSILAAAVYVIVRWILKRFMIGNSRTRRYIAIIPTILFAPVVYYVGFIAICLAVASYPAADFDKQKWDANIEERYTMSKDIINSRMLIDKTYDEVAELLGESGMPDENPITYYLGFVPRLISIDPDVLELYFENGKVVKVSQRRT